MDCMFWETRNGKKLAFFVAHENETKAVFLMLWLREVGLEFVDIIVKSDNEPATEPSREKTSQRRARSEHCANCRTRKVLVDEIRSRARRKELSPEMKICAKWREHGQGESVESRPKRRKASRHRGMETYQDRVPARPSWTAHSNALGNHCNLVGILAVRRTHSWTSPSGNDGSKSMKVHVLRPPQTA